MSHATYATSNVDLLICDGSTNVICVVVMGACCVIFGAWFVFELFLSCFNVLLVHSVLGSSMEVHMRV
jgi:hypothetical protein